MYDLLPLNGKFFCLKSCVCVVVQLIFVGFELCHQEGRKCPAFDPNDGLSRSYPGDPRK